MKKTLIRIIVLTLTLALLLPFASCFKGNDENSGLNTDQTDVINSNKAEAPADRDLEIKVYALNGTTALGMAKMIDSSKNSTDDMNYNISLYPSADAITAAIIKGECAIAALPTNVAVKLFNKSEGKLQLLALNTLGVLYLL